ncbi:GNAT family N-acetyltransferase [Roseomonas elaeocarpi]|uniref:GNAT family N-acetyltransferase n=1 Tax=Roseomonas elaeocarpi TaxID=907779 RepID=A0ABV6JSQ6_9PROT
MILRGRRVVLRPWRAEDRAPFFALNSEPAVGRYLLPMTRAQSDGMLDRADEHFRAHGWGFWAVEHGDTGALIGLCGLSQLPWNAFFTPAVEIGWRLGTFWQGRGLAREAATLSLEAGFGPAGLDRIVAFTVPANTASWGLMERLGMWRIGEFDHPRLPEGHPLSHHYAYEITARRYRDPDRRRD